MSEERDTSLNDFCSRFEIPPNSNQFTPAEALAAAKTLERHLGQWHVPDRDSSPVKWAKFVEAERMKRVTFREEATKGEHIPRGRTVQFYIPGLIAGHDGAALPNPERLTDHSVTLWLVREFYERLTALRENPLWQYLTITFDDLLDEPCYVYREPDPQLDHEFQWVKPGVWAVVGKPVPIDRLSNLVEAAKMVVVQAAGHGAAARALSINSANPQLAKYVNELLDSLSDLSPAIQAEFATLVPVLEFLSSFLWIAFQGGHFKKMKNCREKEFQKKVAAAMRDKLGPDVTEQSSQAGGILDIRYRGAIIELKVEKTNCDRDTVCTKYCEQPTQYAASEARQVSIVLVLDLTEKTLPPGDIRDDIRLVDVPTHGGSDDTKKYPSKAFVLFLNGNLRSPSSYSKK